jgi:hypothetical protein
VEILLQNGANINEKAVRIKSMEKRMIEREIDEEKEMKTVTL